MASEVDISNLALGHLGDDANIASISPPDGSVQAARCAQFYPIARNTVLEMHSWGFNTRRITPAQLDVTVPSGWTFAYAVPSNALKILLLKRSTALPDLFLTDADLVTTTATDSGNSDPFVLETLDDGTSVIYTNTETPSLLYSVLVTDTTKFPPLVVVAIARLLASYLAGPTIKGKAGMEVAEAQMKMFLRIEFGAAAASDANGRNNDPYTNARAASIAARQ